MGGDLFDIFEGKRDKHRDSHYQKDRRYRDDEHNKSHGKFDSHDNRQYEGDNNDYQSHKHEDIGQQVLSMLKENKKLLIAAIIGGIVLLGIIIFVVISLLPMISSIITNISKGGLKGAVDSGMPIINKLLSGAGK
ncbi:MAG: hypothetical protein ABFD76_04620 [Smithella sp.]